MQMPISECYIYIFSLNDREGLLSQFIPASHVIQKQILSLLLWSSMIVCVHGGFKWLAGIKWEEHQRWMDLGWCMIGSLTNDHGETEWHSGSNMESGNDYGRQKKKERKEKWQPVWHLPVPNHMTQSDMESHSVPHCRYEQCAAGLFFVLFLQQGSWSLRPCMFLTFWYLHTMYDVLDTLEIIQVVHFCLIVHTLHAPGFYALSLWHGYS